MKSFLRNLGIAAVLGMGCLTASAAEITGAGATFPYPIYAKWAELYQKETGHRINYQSIGSGGGIKQIKAKTVTFGASDAPLEQNELETSGLVQFPMIIGAVVPVVHLSDVKTEELVLDGPVLADIYLGKIKQWDDVAIKKLNPTLILPAKPILVVHRSDGSGTTFNFTHYLQQVSPEWKAKVGVNTAPEWPVGIGAKGNEGVAGTVDQTAGSIGYVEYAYAKHNKMVVTKMVNKDGKVVAPSIATFQAAAADADWEHAPGFYLILTQQPGSLSWPMTAASFILIPKSPADPKATQDALAFFDWAYQKGGDAAQELDFVPIPKSVAELVRKKVWSEIKKVP